MSTNNTYPIVKVTNNLPHEIEIYDVFNPSKGGVKETYQYTKLSTIASGATSDVQTIRKGSLLQAMFTGVIEQLDNKYYYQFPIKTMSAIQFTFDNPPPLTYSIETSDKASTIQSFLFHRFIMANPNSALTKNLYSALKKGSVDSVNAFFASTKNFKNCTLSSWNIVQTWLQMFTSGWQGPYYLYEEAPTPLPANYIPVLIATLNIVSSAKENLATLSMCSEDAKGNPVFANPPQHTTVVMNGDGTMGDDNPGQDVSVTLTPVWMNVIQTSMKKGTPVSNYLAGPAVTGTVANKKVVSSQTARQLPESKKINTKKTSSFDASFAKLGQMVGLIVGLLFLGEFAMKIGKSAKEKVDKLKEKANSDKDFKDGEETIDKTPDQEVTAEATSKESEFNTDAEEVSQSYNQTSEALQENVMTETMEDTSKNIQEELSNQIEEGYTPTQDFEDAVSDMENSFEEIKTDIENGNFSEANTKLSDVSENMDKTLKDNESSLEDWEKSSLEESSEAVDNAAKESDALDKAQEEHDQEIKDEADDSGFNENDDMPETDSIPEGEMAL
ncbi:hypothetical protein [Aquimarina spongiae]|uniref:Uncharacterized protein n=1 Tax=Aquimarina spongiae TaxID=570521 RepID=A0A1M6KU71_9FLAO|nr:hypothetical protein [Aquimarina spongiae]SHJ62515.1 hypothetical protein SAMN04488508_11270 [Aquimarina spongiae]